MSSCSVVPSGIMPGFRPACCSQLATDPIRVEHPGLEISAFSESFELLDGHAACSDPLLRHWKSLSSQLGLFLFGSEVERAAVPGPYGFQHLFIRDSGVRDGVIPAVRCRNPQGRQEYQLVRNVRTQISCLIFLSRRAARTRGFRSRTRGFSATVVLYVVSRHRTNASIVGSVIRDTRGQTTSGCAIVAIVKPQLRRTSKSFAEYFRIKSRPSMN